LLLCKEKKAKSRWSEMNTFSDYNAFYSFVENNHCLWLVKCVRIFLSNCGMLHILLPRVCFRVTASYGREMRTRSTQYKVHYTYKCGRWLRRRRRCSGERYVYMYTKLMYIIMLSSSQYTCMHKLDHILLKITLHLDCSVRVYSYILSYKFATL